jgi:nitrate/TMAO reductase-like tetraheme cytochrome c subunit
MTTEQSKRGYLNNWTSLVGVIMASLGFIVGIVSLAADFLNPNKNAYSGIFTYMVVPVVVAIGLLLIAVGYFRQRRQRPSPGASAYQMPVINLNIRGQYIAFVIVVIVVFLFVLFAGVGSFSAYKYTESVSFCGSTCHTPMKPEYTAYKDSPHSHVGCVDCHIGPGAQWFVKAKLSGLHQVYAVAANNFKRPIATPISNLRPASETCYQCHWPAKFFGELEQTRTYFAADKANTPYTISYLLNVGGGDPTHGPARGIHYHMAVAQRIQYIAKDVKRQVIPWVSSTDAQGHVSIYKTNDKDVALTDDKIASAEKRVMDCMDCHNRPAHQFQSPDRAINLAMSEGTVSPSIEFIKKNAAMALLGTYTTREQAISEIDKQLHVAYPKGGDTVEAAIKEVKEIYSRNFFPEMKADWRAYPDNIGHEISSGCFRCHDGKHANEKGEVISHECKTCHVITSQGPGAKPITYVRSGLDFVHPVQDDDGSWKTENCSECHTGAPEF